MEPHLSAELATNGEDEEYGCYYFGSAVATFRKKQGKASVGGVSMLWQVRFQSDDRRRTWGLSDMW